MDGAEQTQGLFLNVKQIQEFLHLLRDETSVIRIRKIDPVLIDNLYLHVLPFGPAYRADIVTYSFSNFPAIEQI